MATGQLNSVIRHVRRAALRQDDTRTDGQLLEHFVAQREEAAFEALVRRHGSMVLGVCRRVLHNTHDAEDAFQATFLVLVRKAASLLPRAALGNWLYGVAYHTALKARAQAVRRRAKEAQVRHMPRQEAADTGTDWQPVLDQELSRLPDKYREPLVLCELQGKTVREAARQLGIADGTLSGRLTTARRRLANRLARRGVTLSAGALAAVLSQSGASAALPAPLVVGTVKAAAVLAAGETAAGVISVNVAALTEGVLKAMLVTKLKATAAFLMVIGLFVGGGTLVHHALAGAAEDRPIAKIGAALPLDEQPVPERSAAQRQKAQAKDANSVSGNLRSVDADKNTVTVIFSNRTEGQTEKTFQVAKDAKIVRDGKEVKLSDLKERARIMLRVSPDQKTALGISVTGPSLVAQVKSVDAAKKTVTVTMDNARKGKFDKTHPVATDAKVTIDGKDAKLSDVREGAMLFFQLSAEDGNTAIQIQTPRRGRPEGDE